MAEHYATTRRVLRPKYGQLQPSQLRWDYPGDDAPVPPPGEGWVMVGSTSASVQLTPDADHVGILVLWFWRRREVKKTRPCKSCGAVARKNGRCIGCGAEAANV